MNQQTLYIAFGDRQVAVHSHVPEVLAGAKRNFRHMIELEPKKVIGQLEVCWKNGEYHIIPDSEASAQNRTLSDVLPRLKYEVVMRLIQARPDLLWFHAGAAAYRGSAVVFCAPGGRGKSTLVTSLCKRGWTYLSDDVVPLDLNSGKVIPFPLTPAVRENIGQELPLDRLKELNKTEVNLKPETVCREAMPIGALIFPTYSLHSPTGLLLHSPGTAALELLQNCVNFANHRQVAVREVCERVLCLPTFGLSFSSGSLAAELIAHKYEKQTYLLNT
jgi:hypothetical protein